MINGIVRIAQLRFISLNCRVLTARLALFFFNDTATTEIYTLSLHDALPICSNRPLYVMSQCWDEAPKVSTLRSEEHTSELQSQSNLVCRLLLEKKIINFTN